MARWHQVHLVGVSSQAGEILPCVKLFIQPHAVKIPNILGKNNKVPINQQKQLK